MQIALTVNIVYVSDIWDYEYSVFDIYLFHWFDIEWYFTCELSLIIVWIFSIWICIGLWLVLCDTWNWNDDNDTVSGIAILDTTAIPEMQIAQCNFNVVQNSPVSQKTQ